MKTQNNTQETVLSQVRSLVLRASAVICSLALISLTVNAQNLWKQFSTSNTYEKMAMLMVGQSTETEKVDAVFDAIDAGISSKLNQTTRTFIYEAEQEDQLQIEAWMTDGTNFNSNAHSTTVETEEALEIESWMISNSNFRNNLVSVIADQEKPLEIESWLTQEECFMSEKSVTGEEAELQIENWMLDTYHFNSSLNTEENTGNKPLQLEAWMTDNQKWAL